jgi:Domain of unknown function (DUF4157)
MGNQSVKRLLQVNAEAVKQDSAIATSTRFAHDFGRISVHDQVPPRIQPKLTVNTPSDSYEQQADRVSEQVMRMPEPRLQPTGACGGAGPKCQTGQPGRGHEHLQMKLSAPGDAGFEVLSSPGQPLDAKTLTFMEPRFGKDFSDVRVHSDVGAVESSEAVQARAYTAGHDIVFGAGQFAPRTSRGRRLLAHVERRSTGRGGINGQRGSTRKLCRRRRPNG